MVQLAIDDGGQELDAQEFEELVTSAGGKPVAMVTGHRRAPTAKFFVGTGKLDEIRRAIDIALVELIDNAPSLNEAEVEQANDAKIDS